MHYMVEVEKRVFRYTYSLKRTREFKNETSENGLTEDRRKLTFLLPHAL